MLNMTPMQIIGLWDDLHAALAGTNSHGGDTAGDTAEIYAFRVGNGMRLDRILKSEAYHKFVGDGDLLEAAANLHDLILLFCDRHKCKARIDDLPPREWILDQKADPSFCHRVHVQITKTD